MIITRASFIQELAAVDGKLLRMGGTVRGMIVDSVNAYLNSEMHLVDTVFRQDDLVDALDDDVETTCMRLLALQQPMARDLRRVNSASRVSSELERMADHAVEIGRSARKIHTQFFPVRPLLDISRMASAAEQMLDDSLTAFINHDIGLVEQICQDDDIVDAEYKVHRDQLIEIASNDSSKVGAATFTLLIVASIERIADHATNIAERVSYIETGTLRRISRMRKPQREDK